MSKSTACANCATLQARLAVLEADPSIRARIKDAERLAFIRSPAGAAARKAEGEKLAAERLAAARERRPKEVMVYLAPTETSVFTETNPSGQGFPRYSIRIEPDQALKELATDVDGWMKSHPEFARHVRAGNIVVEKL